MNDRLITEALGNQSDLHVHKSDSCDKIPLLCAMYRAPKDNESLRNFWTDINRMIPKDPTLFRFEVLVIGESEKANNMIPNHIPAHFLPFRNLFHFVLAYKIRSFLKEKKVDLIKISPDLEVNWIRFITLGFSIPIVMSSPSDSDGLFAERKNKGFFVKTNSSNEKMEAFEDFQSYAGEIRTTVRNREFQKKRKGISFLRKTTGAILSRPKVTSGTLRILMYHRVTDTMETDILAVTPFAFAQQMKWLKEEGWQVIPLKEALLRLEKGSLPERSVAITFDDGYRDNYEEALPVLEKFGFSATIFPVTGFVLGESEHRRYRGRIPGIPYLTVDQIRLMKGMGIDFGGHTHTHPILSEISIESATEEILRAKKLLEEWTGERITLFAYPNGAYLRDHFRILDGLGFEAAFSVRPGANQWKTLRWILQRTEISGRDSLGDFIQKMNGGLDLWHSLYQGVRGFYK